MTTTDIFLFCRLLGRPLEIFLDTSINNVHKQLCIFIKTRIYGHLRWPFFSPFGFGKVLELVSICNYLMYTLLLYTIYDMMLSQGQFRFEFIDLFSKLDLISKNIFWSLYHKFCNLNLLKIDHYKVSS